MSQMLHWLRSFPITRGLCVFGKCLPPCVCVCVPDLMRHLKGCDSSWCLQREARLVLCHCGGCLRPKM